MPRPFHEILAEMPGGGAIAEDLSEQLARLVLAVLDTEKSGKLNLTITLKPNDGTVAVATELKVTTPQPTRGAGIFFADGEGNLLRRDPRQTDMFSSLREVPRSDRVPA